MKHSNPAAEPETSTAFPLIESARRRTGRGLRYAQYARTTMVLRKGSRVSGAYVVVRGRLRVYTLAPNGNEATLYTLDPGETCVLALNCIFNDLLYPAWVEAEAATQVALIPGPLYRTLFESDTAVRNLTVQAFSTMVFRLMGELEQIHSHHLDQRLANFLLLRASADGTVRMTQQHIASHLGTTREVVARVLRRFVAEKLIDTRRKQLVILRPTSLAARLNPDRASKNRRSAVAR